MEWLSSKQKAEGCKIRSSEMTNRDIGRYLEQKTTNFDSKKNAEITLKVVEKHIDNESGNQQSKWDGKI